MPTGSILNDSQKVNITNSIVCYVWSGAGTGNAPDATTIPNFTVGVDAGGAATGVLWWVINGTWVTTTATVANLYGG